MSAYENWVSCVRELEDIRAERDKLRLESQVLGDALTDIFNALRDTKRIVVEQLHGNAAREVAHGIGDCMARASGALGATMRCDYFGHPLAVGDIVSVISGCFINRHGTIRNLRANEADVLFEKIGVRAVELQELQYNIWKGLPEEEQTAMTKSLEYADANPDAVREIMATYTKTDPAVLAEITLPKYPTEMDRASIEKLAAAAQEYGVLKAEPDFDNLLP